MKAFLIKELREHFHWSVLAGIAFLGTILLAYRMDEEGFQAHPLLTASVQNNVFWACMAWGSLLGFLQFLRESHGELRGLTLHRPVPVRTVFWAKLLAGMVMLVTTLVVPILILCWWWSLPASGRPPFFLAYCEPLLLIATMSLLSYLAAASACVRQSRWWVSRWMPIGLSLLIAICLHQAVGMQMVRSLFIGVTALLLLLQALGWMQAGGRDEAAPWWAVASWSASMLVPITLFLLALIPASASLPAGTTWFYERHVLAEDGSASIDRTELDGSSQSLDEGRLPISIPKPGDQGLIRLIPADEEATGWVPGPHAWLWDDRSFWNLQVETLNQPRQDEQGYQYYWCGLPEAVMACDKKTGAVLGYVTEQGIVADLPDSWRRTPYTDFPASSGTQKFITHAGTAYRVDVQKGMLMPVVVCRPGEHLVAGMVWLHGQPPWIWFGTTQRLVLVEHGQATLEIPVLPEWSRGSVTILRVDRTNAWSILFTTPIAGGQDVLYTYASDGRQLSRTALTALTSVSRPTGMLDLSFDAPLLPILAVAAVDARARTLVEATLASLLAAALLLWCLRSWGRSTTELVAWGLATLLIGPPVLVACFCLRSAPARERCPSCGRNRLVTRELCEHCQAPFSPMPRSEIGIFDVPVAALPL